MLRRYICRNLLNVSYYKGGRFVRFAILEVSSSENGRGGSGHQKYIIYSTNFGEERCSYDAHRLYMWLALDGETPAIWTAPRVGLMFQLCRS
jgi:hypothetical protein